MDASSRHSVDGDDVVGAVLAHAAATVGETDVALTGAPAQALLVTRDRLHGDVEVEASEPAQLLAHDGGLEVALRGERDVLEVAAAAGVGAGVRARGRHAVGRRLDHRHGVAAPEPVAVRALGEDELDGLTGQRVPDEDDAQAVAVGHPGDAVAAVRHRTDLRGEALPHP